LGSDVPEVDFTAYADEVRTFEAEYKANHPGPPVASVSEANTETVQNPRVVCVSSAQFLKLGFENQLDLVLNAFPSAITHERVFSSKELSQLLAGKRFDIVHVAAFVCPRTGDLYFSDVDLNSGESISAEVDVITADAFTSLLEMARTRLVVITSCESLVLAATLVEVVNVVATRDMVSPKMMAAWVESFYGMLPSQPIQQAFDYAIKASRAPMRYYGRHSVIFTVERTTGHAV
jgi:hypothetical protein